MQKKVIRKSLTISWLSMLVTLLLAACGDPVNTLTVPTATSRSSTVTTPAAATTAASATTAAVAASATKAGVTAAPVTSAAATTSAPTPAATGVAAFIYYLKEGNLISVRPGGGGQHVVANNVYKPMIIRDNQVVYYEEVTSGSDTVVQLKLAVEAIAGNFKETVLDSQAMVPLSAANRDKNNPYGQSLERLTNLDISPDGTQVIYTKTNASGPTFENFGTKNYPTELWLANLNPQNPAPKRLVPNNKDIITKPIWSSDGNRIAFLRSDNFGTGAGYGTAIWSVYKDGTRLAFLTGPKLSKGDDQKATASPASNLVWVGPLALTFQGFNQINKPLWLHDLTQSSDYPRPLVPDAGEAFYCSQLRRYVYVRQGLQPSDNGGVYSVDVDKPGTNNGPPLPAPIDETASQVLGCEGNTVLYLDAKGQVTLQRLNPEGSMNGPKMKLGAPIGGELSNFQNQGIAALSPEARVVVISGKANKGISVFRADGTAIAVANAPANLERATVQWINEQLAVVTSDSQLFEIDLSQPNPSVRQVDSSSNTARPLAFVVPRRTAA